MEIIHGRNVVKIGNRYFAVAKQQSMVDRLAAHSSSAIKGTAYECVLRQAGRAHVISNIR